MSKLQFSVRTIKAINTPTTLALTKEVSQPLRLPVAPSTGRVHVVLHFKESYKIKNIIFKNAGSAFLSVYAGTDSDFAALSAASKDPFPVLESLPVLVPPTQLCNFAQAVQAAPQAPPPPSASTPSYKVRAFPSAKYSRYVRERSWSFLVLEMKPFVDQPALAQAGTPVGLSWIEVYGEPCSLADSLASTDRSLLASAQAGSAASTAMSGMDSAEWMKDAESDQAAVTKTGAAGFKPTGAAERAWAMEQARAPPRAAQAAAASAAAAAPILHRNASFLANLRDGVNAAASAPASAAASAFKPPPPSCPTHPLHPTGMLRRADRSNPAQIRTFYVCTATNADGTPCNTKTYVD